MTALDERWRIPSMVGSTCCCYWYHNTIILLSSYHLSINHNTTIWIEIWTINWHALDIYNTHRSLSSASSASSASSLSLSPVILFMPGGAWGSGSKLQYSLLGPVLDCIVAMFVVSLIIVFILISTSRGSYMMYMQLYHGSLWYNTKHYFIISSISSISSPLLLYSSFLFSSYH
jgi:hypothetical protein